MSAEQESNCVLRCRFSTHENAKAVLDKDKELVLLVSGEPNKATYSLFINNKRTAQRFINQLQELVNQMPGNK